MQKPKDKLQIDIFLEFWVVFTVSSFVGNPVDKNRIWRHSRPYNQWRHMRFLSIYDDMFPTLERIGFESN